MKDLFKAATMLSRLLVLLYVFIDVDCLVMSQYFFEGLQPYVVVFKRGISSDVRQVHIEDLDVDSFSLGDHVYADSIGHST